ncbi:MAG: ArsC family reductase [Gluconobacter potus]|uniref:ArsC family reductase n=1 Tax=Gluconobacter potus TaxID=2724927 RepID=A0ABR9YID6_9PROT|nr:MULTISPECIES: ArsC family reductase [Gluconobacter]MBF0863496.1 ArsC family reductase [Gluconobacter sp. R71656]MBF0866303.1 ArsC family reductase [Gluconobacter sp. R75628]MBF0872569.1 ArsC family reductase [Gluconobacter sp. R75629]MBF0881535.1 ArsC family reductase [Gluconobacter potus]
MAASVTIYGISNCDTMRKARIWLGEHKVAFTFHDYRRDGVDRSRLEGWVARLGWEKLLNRSGTTFRKLVPELREGLDAERAIALMLEHPAMIRRPVLEGPGLLLVGFRPEDYASGLSGFSAQDPAP